MRFLIVKSFLRRATRATAFVSPARPEILEHLFSKLDERRSSESSWESLGCCSGVFPWEPEHLQEVSHS